MIVVTTLKGERLAINDQLIERVEDDNETRVILTSGARYIVAESVDEIVRLSRQDRAEVHAMARRLAARIDAEPCLSANAGAAGGDSEENIVRLDRRSTPSDGSG
jgi:flagellar protein FlbD